MATPLDDKERELVDRLKQQPGLVLAYPPGFGKTRKSIQIGQGLGLPIEAIVPAALKANYAKEEQKWLGEVPPENEIKGQEEVARYPDRLSTNPNRLAVVDESQRIRNPNNKLYAAIKKINAQKRLLLSGTMAYNHPADIAAQVNFAANQEVLPTDRKEFERKFVEDHTVKPGFFGSVMGVKPGKVKDLKNKDELKKALKKYVDYAELDPTHYPATKEETVRVPLGQHQQDLYNTILGKADFWTRYKIKHNLPPTRSELKKMLPFLTGVRQTYLSNAPFTTDPSTVEQPKIDMAVKYLAKQVAANPRYKAIVYSNYINSGLRPYASQLQKRNIPYGEFSGEVPDKVREQNLRDYNMGKLKALLISGAGAQGLDTKGTRLIQMLEPSWNRALEDQIAGRGVRNHSHDELPPEERNVLIQRYLAAPKPGMFSGIFGSKPETGADEYISNISQNKDRLNQQIYQILKENAGGANARI